MFGPSFALFPCEIKDRFPSPELISVTSSSSLTIDGNVIMESVKLDGALRLLADAAGGKLTVKAGHMVSSWLLKTTSLMSCMTDTRNGRQVVWNAGYAVRSTWTGSEATEVVAMRGYSLHKVAEELVVARAGQEVVYTGKTVAMAAVSNGSGRGEQEVEASCTETDTCGGCLLSAFFRFLLLQ